MHSQGCATTVAKNGKLGLALLKTEPFDLVLMDFLMVRTSSAILTRGLTLQFF